MIRFTLIALFVIPSLALADNDPLYQGKKRSEWESMLREQQNVRLRKVAVISLGQIVSENMNEVTLVKEVMGLIGRTLKTDAAPTVRLQAAMVCNQMAIKLVESKTADPVPVIADLTDNLRSEKEAEVLREVCIALGRFGDKSRAAASALTDQLKHKEVSIREASTMTLGRIGAEAKGAAPEVIRLLKDPEKSVQLAAIFAIGRIEPEDTAAASIALIPFLDPKYEVALRKEVLISLGLIGDATPATIKAFAARLKDDEVEIRRQAATTLAKYRQGIKQVETELKAAISSDKDKDVRVYSLRSLWEGYGEDAKTLIPFLAERLKADESFDVRLTIIEQFAELGENGKDAIPALREAQRDAQVKIREAAGNAIKRIEKPKPKM